MKNFYFIGIGGVGMSSLAHILLDQNISVEGSDIQFSSVIKNLQLRGVKIYLEHKKSNLKPEHTVVYSSAISQDNEELIQAKKLGLSIIHRAQLLELLIQDFKNVVITGSHGKTTTTALLVEIFKKSFSEVSFSLGGFLKGENAKKTSSEYFIVEGDESDGSLKFYNPWAGIITNIDSEHMDYYQSIDNLVITMKKFAKSVRNKDLMFYCADDPFLRKNLEGLGLSYGFHHSSSILVYDYRVKQWNSVFNIKINNQVYEAVVFSKPGEFNALNASVAFALSMKLGLKEKDIREALASFSFLSRRLEKKNDDKKLLFLDDYAHHPKEIFSTLKALRYSVGERRIVAVCQPHRYSRLKKCWKDYCSAFDFADEVIITEVYSAGEKKEEGVTGELLAKDLEKHFLGGVHFIPFKNIGNFLQEFLYPHDVCITLGAGDIFKIHDQLKIINWPKCKLGIVFGGETPEHEISILSAKNVFYSLDKDIYDVTCFFIDKTGKWHLSKDIENLCFNKRADFLEKDLSISEVIPFLDKCEVFFPIIHGSPGEDGVLQGFFSTLGKAFVFSNVLPCSVAMNKIVSKRIAMSLNIPTARFYDFDYSEWLKNQDRILDFINNNFSFPIFLKAVNLGSSIGIVLIENKNMLRKEIQENFMYDRHLFVEESKLGSKEIEFSFLGLENLAITERLSRGTFISYNKKYGFQGEEAVKSFPPNIDKKLLEEGRLLASMLYKHCGFSGGCRLDFFLDKNNKFWFLEANPIPGMTETSPFMNALVNQKNISNSEFCNMLVIQGLKESRKFFQRKNTVRKMLLLQQENHENIAFV